MIIYIDNFLLFGKDSEAIRTLKIKLQDHLILEDIGPYRQFLGTKVIRDRKSRAIHLVQDQYIDRIIRAFDMGDCTTVSMPMDAGAGAVMVPSTEEPDIDRTKVYQSLNGADMFAMTQTRPDLAYAESTLSRFNSNPSQGHLKAAKRVVRYLKGTRNLGITYRGGTQGFLNIDSYADSNYAGDLETRRSTTGYVVFMAGGPVVWRAQRQKSVTLSSTEAEYYALSGIARELSWIRQFLTEVGYSGPDLRPAVIHGDNQGSLYLAENPQYHQKTKHIDVQYHYIRQEIKAGNIVLDYVPTENMAADGVTKPLPLTGHQRFVKLLNMEVWDSTNR